MSERKGPQCAHMLRTKGGVHRRCVREGVHCYIVGEFGRSPMALCGPCVTALRGIGWKVTYQLEGDAQAENAQKEL